MFRSLLAKRKQFVPDNSLFFLNREGFVLGKQGICLHQHALASYIITQCILRGKSVNFISFLYIYTNLKIP